MDKKMTSGEIAKKAGVSQKAIRLYDEKGLLKPSEYSEGNYRLYDKEALLVLEKIIALKQVGFSLEEIHDNLIAEKNMDITESLNRQLELMEKKKQEIERTIKCIKGMLARTDGQPDWNSVAEIARMIQKDQGADERHFHALKHTADKTDWYVKIYNSLNVKENSRVLDLGCGYGKLWRNNWTDIPAGVMVQGVDLRGSWAESFEKYIEAHSAGLSEACKFRLQWADVEAVEIWDDLSEGEKYTYVVAHYLFSFIKNKELLIERVASVLAEGGMFSCNDCEVSSEHFYWQQILEDIGLKNDFISEKIHRQEVLQEEFVQLLYKYFKTIETVSLSNNMKYADSTEVFERLCERYPESGKYLKENDDVIKKYFDSIIAENGDVIVSTSGQFIHCYK